AKRCLWRPRLDLFNQVLSVDVAIDLVLVTRRERDDGHRLATHARLRERGPGRQRSPNESLWRQYDGPTAPGRVLTADGGSGSVAVQRLPTAAMRRILELRSGRLLAGNALFEVNRARVTRVELWIRTVGPPVLEKRVRKAGPRV